MKNSYRWRAVPGGIASALCILLTCVWTYWGVQELFHEGWYGPLPQRLLYLVPAGFCLVLTLIALVWPRLGGWALIVAGVAGVAWWSLAVARRGHVSLGGATSMLAVIGGLALIGILFLLEARHRRSRAAAGWTPPASWLRRNLVLLLALALPLLLGLALSIEPALRVTSRLDDGWRGVRRIEGNGVVLLWAPAGPGWVSSTSGPSWNQLGLYGVPPVGMENKCYGLSGQCLPGSAEGCATLADVQTNNLCRYLDEAGTRLLDEPTGIWRLPTVDELVRSLSRHGENAGCAWGRGTGRAECRILPDKETPLWDPTGPVIYYWAADEYDATSVYYVVYNGGVYAADKSSAMGSRGYRCVREP